MVCRVPSLKRAAAENTVRPYTRPYCHRHNKLAMSGCLFPCVPTCCLVVEAGQCLLSCSLCTTRAAGIDLQGPSAASNPVRAATEACLLCLGLRLLSGFGPQRSVGVSPHGVVLETGLCAWLHKSVQFLLLAVAGETEQLQ
ncbi:hypothetical protein NDU88_010426 [Pleurodeles waltl]|uniref:Uncharacterized protein n=1 Tax=Pleurodeles waltl TaxID=8319 RepID=A0AAV7PUT2_PLEWA|nr:hypothetical protein NDU88_010426 [Pleurodeles waltl]